MVGAKLESKAQWQRVRGNWLILTFDSLRHDLSVSGRVTEKIPETSSFFWPSFANDLPSPAELFLKGKEVVQI